MDGQNKYLGVLFGGPDGVLAGRMGSPLQNTFYRLKLLDVSVRESNHSNTYNV